MDADEAESSALREVLEEWFLAQAENRSADLEKLCKGDQALMKRALALLDMEPTELADGSAVATSLPFERLGEYRIEALLGTGGMGAVYLARQESLGREVALKVLTFVEPAGSMTHMRFRREAELMASLDHPGIVPIYAVGEDSGHAFLAMKRLSGPSLGELADAPEPGQVAEYGVQIARALDVAHLAGVVHRDIKPTNVLLDHGQAVLVDFGLARAQFHQTLTRAGSVPGTLPYLPPEVLRERGARIDPRHDVYSLGATLHELLSGEPAFREETPEQLVRSILEEEPPRLLSLGVPKDLETVVRVAMAKDPAQRYPSAADLADDLQRFLVGAPIHARTPGILARCTSRIRNHPRTSLGAGFVLIAGSVLGARVLSSNARQSEVIANAVSASQAALATGDWRRAKENLGAIREIAAGHEKVADILKEVRGRQALDELLNTLVQGGAFMDRAELADGLAELESSSAEAYQPKLAAQAACLARYLIGEKKAAQSALDGLVAGFGNERTAVALAGLIGGEWPEDLPPHPKACQADEAVLCSLVMFFAGRSPAEQESELSSALHLAPAHPRALARRTGQLLNRGLHEQALLSLEAFPNSPGLKRKRDRLECLALTQLGRYELAQRALDRIPRESRIPVEHHLQFDLLTRHGEPEAIQEHVDRYLDRPDASIYAQRDYAEYLAYIKEPNDLPRALGKMQRLLNSDLDPIDRDWIGASRYFMQVLDVTGYFEDEPKVIAPSTREELLATGMQLLGDVVLSSPQARIHQGLALLHEYAGDSEQEGAVPLGALENYRMSVDLRPHDFEYMQRFFGFLEGQLTRPDLANERLQSLADLALDRGRRLMVRVESGNLKSCRIPISVVSCAATAELVQETTGARLTWIPILLERGPRNPDYLGGPQFAALYLQAACLAAAAALDSWGVEYAERLVARVREIHKVSGLDRDILNNAIQELRDLLGPQQVDAPWSTLLSELSKERD